MGRIPYILLGLCLLFLLVSCSGQETSESQAPKVELMVASAASLTDAMNELKAKFEEQNLNIKVSFHFGSSGKLAKQIEQGAPSDIFLSASKKDMDTLEGKNLVVKESRKDFAANKLVLITNQNSSLTISSFEDIPVDQIQHMAIGEPESVPVGRYAKEALVKIGLWKPLEAKLVLGSDARQVLTYVESGNADLGVVYASDAAISNKVKVLAEAQSDWHQPIVYPAAIVEQTAHQKEAQAFMDFLFGQAGQAALKKYGFE